MAKKPTKSSATKTAAGRRHAWDAPPALEWAAAGFGLVTSLGAIGYILWIAAQPVSPPDLTVRATAIRPLSQGYAVDVEAENAGRATAAAVEIEGSLELGAEDETRVVSFDYVPGHGARKATMVFEHDPRRAPLSLRATGFTKP